MEVVASLSQGRTAAAQCVLFTHKSVPVIFEPSCTQISNFMKILRVGAGLFNAVGRTDSYEEVLVTFRNFAKSPKKTRCLGRVQSLLMLQMVVRIFTTEL